MAATMIEFGRPEKMDQRWGRTLYRCTETRNDGLRCGHYEATPGPCWQHRKTVSDHGRGGEGG